MDTVAVTDATAKKWNLKTIADLAPHSAEVKFGCARRSSRPGRSGCPDSRRSTAWTSRPANFVAISDGGGPATVRALVDGTVTAANIFSTSPAIPQNNLVVLEDPKNNFLAANVVPLVNSQKKSDQLKTVLDAVSAKLTTEATDPAQHRRVRKHRHRPGRGGPEMGAGQRLRQAACRMSA